MYDSERARYFSSASVQYTYAYFIQLQMFGGNKHASEVTACDYKQQWKWHIICSTSMT